MVRLRGWLERLFGRRRRPAPAQHPALVGTRWTGIYAGIPHRPLRPDDERVRQAEINAANRPRPWLAPREKERW